MWHNEYFWIPGLMLAGATAFAGVTRTRVFRVPQAKGLPGRGLPLLDTAFLAGGPGRVFDTALVAMHQGGRVIVSRGGTVTWTGLPPADEVEQAIVDAVGPQRRHERLRELRADVMRSPAVQRIGDRLAERGLMRNPALLDRARFARRFFWPANLTLIGVSLGGILTAGLDSEPLSWFAMVFLWFVGVMLPVALRLPKGRITPAGRTQLSLMTQGSSPWRPQTAAATDTAVGVVLGAVALTGLEAGLPDLELQEALLEAGDPVRAAAGAPYGGGSSSSSSSSSSSCGGGTTLWCGSSGSGSSSSGCGSSSCGSSSSGSGCGSSSSSCGGGGSSCGGGGGGCGGGS